MVRDHVLIGITENYCSEEARQESVHFAEVKENNKIDYKTGRGGIMKLAMATGFNRNMDIMDKTDMVLSMHQRK